MEHKESNIKKVPSEENDFYSDDDLYNIASWGADLSFRELITMYDEDELIKPEIQRNYVWKKPEASRFIESLLMGLPVPSIFLAQKGTKKLIVDGFQRIMTVRDFTKGIFTADNSIFKLSNSKMINERWRGKSFEQLKEDDKRKIRSTLIHAIIFEQKEPKDTDTSLYQVFERINTSGRSLTNQEIRNCVYQGKVNSMLIELNNNPIWRKLYGSDDINNRMNDMEFILRFFALKTKNVLESKMTQISLKKELNLFMGSKENDNSQKIELYKKEFIKVINFLYEKLGECCFYSIKKNDDGDYTEVKKFHPTIFDSIGIATIIAFNKNSTLVIDDLKSKKLELLKNEDYIDCTTIRTTNVSKINRRINLALKILYNID